MNRPLLGMTMGDPAGIGPEVIVGSWDQPRLFECSRRFVLGRSAVMRAAVELLDKPLTVQSISGVEQIDDSPDTIPVWELATDCDDAPRRAISSVAGKAAVEAVNVAARMALAGHIDGLVTAPLNKAAIHAAGVDFPGHTELLASICEAANVAMMLYLPARGQTGSPSAIPSPSLQPQHLLGEIGLGVVHVTLHVALRSVFDGLSMDAIVDRCHLATGFARAMLGERSLARQARIGVAALNPHGGEGGLFGREEQELIEPAVARAQSLGYPAVGPLPCDTLMHRAAAGEFDVIVAMYHDQGHIALKLLGLQQAVNVTLGLPILRTSVAHGTAFDIAWKGQAQSGSMAAAVELASQLARNRAFLKI